MNVITLSGRITTDPVLKSTTTGKAYAKFNVATHRPISTQTGNKKTDFIPCILWGQSAELFASTVKKGHRINITGSMYADDYEKDGIKKTNFYVNVERFEYVENKPNTNSEQKTSKE